MEAGGITRDLRTQDIDLTHYFRPVEVTVVDQSGSPVEHANLRQSVGGSWRATASTDARGRSVLAVPPSGLELEILAQGYRLERQKIIAANQVFRLRPGIPVRVDPISLPADLGGDVMVTVHLIHEGTNWLSWLSPGGRALLPLPGVYRIKWEAAVLLETESRAMMMPESLGFPQTIQGIRDRR